MKNNENNTSIWCSDDQAQHSGDTHLFILWLKLLYDDSTTSGHKPIDNE